MTRVLPGVSLVMTVLNEAVAIRAFLDSLGRLEALPEEIVVVDGGSKDDTVALLRGWAPPSGVRLQVESRPGANISEGRNIAIAAAAGPWIAVTDAGTVIDAAWLSALAARMTDGTDVVSGFFLPLRGTRLASTIAAVITPTLDEIDPPTFLPSSRSVAFRKAAWASVGGYPEWLDYCEDLVYDIALRDRGAVFAFAPDAIVSWDARPHLRAFFKQYYRYARGDGKADLYLKRHVARYGAYAIGLGLILTAILAWAPALPVSIVALALLVIGGAGYLRKFWRRVVRRRGTLLDGLALPLLMTPIIVATGDVAKMLGYPVGTIWRWRRKSGHD